MGEFEEETYSTVFTALKHPVRRKILRTLSESPRSFTDLQNSFNVNGAVLTYHLEAMKELVSKTDDGKYGLTDMGVGAIELMERVEEPPKTMPFSESTADEPSKRGKRLLTVQAVLVFAAITLLVSGSYLASITTVQVYYNLPYESYSVKQPTLIGGNVYDTSINTTVPPPSELLNHRIGTISVGFNSLEHVSSGVYLVTVNYLEYIPTQGNYVERELNYSGVFMPTENRNGDVFSTLIIMPLSSTTPKEPVLNNIVISTWMNTTEPNPAVLPIVKAPISLSEGGYIITQPYQDQSGILMNAGIVLLILALFLSILSLLRRQT
jgi:DNA-binding transcriptional ArsR family regulator